LWPLLLIGQFLGSRSESCGNGNVIEICPPTSRRSRPVRTNKRKIWAWSPQPKDSDPDQRSALRPAKCRGPLSQGESGHDETVRSVRAAGGAGSDTTRRTRHSTPPFLVVQADVRTDTQVFSFHTRYECGACAVHDTTKHTCQHRREPARARRSRRFARYPGQHMRPATRATQERVHMPMVARARMELVLIADLCPMSSVRQ